MQLNINTQIRNGVCECDGMTFRKLENIVLYVLTTLK